MSHKEQSLRYYRRESRDERDIGTIPSPVSCDRRNRCTNSLSSFCKEYQPEIFTRPFASIHREVITRLEEAIGRGGLFAYAMPRGTGKTCIAEAAVLWAVLFAKRRYVVLIAATEKPHAQRSLENIKKELSTNQYILEDFPEIVYPIWCLENIAHKASGQTYNGVPTYIVWRGSQLVLPTIPGSLASGSVIEIRGMTGSIRGMKCNLPGGRGSIRPELIIIDDPQTDKSAKSPPQCKDREEIILGTILGLGGHEHKISAVMPCTVIHKGDLAESFLDREKHPEWNGIRSRLLVSMPKNMKLWEEYEDRKREGKDTARLFYLDNRIAMDDGAESSLPEWYNGNQVSAIQYAMDLRSLVGEQAFQAEYQNEPLTEVSDGEVPSADDICTKITNYKRWEVPINCQHITAYIDVHKRVLFYMVCAWERNFNGYIIQYGTWPQTSKKYFLMRDLHETLQAKYKGQGQDGAIYSGLRELSEKLVNRQYRTTGLRLEKCIIDANWKTSVVKAFCREHANAALVIPGHGRFIGASRKPLNEYRRSAGDIIGLGWRIPMPVSRGGIRHVIYDVNRWKTFVNSALLAPPGERGCLQLFGGQGCDHKLLSEHLTSEYYVEVSGRGRVVHEWNLYPSCTENHWWDCLVGCAVGASMLGCETIDTTAKPRKPYSMRYLKI